MGNTAQSGYRSLFWPLILIGVGIVWLMNSLGVISGANIAVLFRLWPLLLIAIGLDLLFGRRAPLLGALIGLGTLAVAIVLMLIGPGLGLAGNYEVTSETFSETLGDARTAEVTLNLSVGEATITPLRDSSDLIHADLNYVGNVEFRVEGQSDKVVYLGQQGEVNTSGPFGFFNWFGTDQLLRWDIGLSPNVEMRLTVNGGVGDSRLDLQGLQITDLSVTNGVGGMNLTLPAAEGRYAARINGGVGDITLTVPEGADVALNISGGVGSFTIDVPDGAAVRLDADTGLGDVNVPGWLTRVSGDEDNGIWESDGFSSAEHPIVIEFNGGVGSLTVR